MPLLRPDELRDRNDVTLPDATSRSFWLNGSTWAYPDSENAEIFVGRLVHAGLIAVDHSVEGTLPQSTARMDPTNHTAAHLQATGADSQHDSPNRSAPTCDQPLEARRLVLRGV